LCAASHALAGEEVLLRLAGPVCSRAGALPEEAPGLRLAEFQQGFEGAPAGFGEPGRVGRIVISKVPSGMGVAPQRIRIILSRNRLLSVVIQSKWD
jgi:hypothetical protein